MSDRPPGHIVKSFEHELNQLRDLITQIGGIVENQVALAAQAVVSKDTAAATRAVEDDPRVDALEREVEAFVIRLLALRQPVAVDLRHVIAALKITGDLERIGDYAANVAKRSIVLSEMTLSSLRRAGAHGAAGAGESEERDRCVRRERPGARRGGLAFGRRDRRHVQRDLSRADHLHDGGSAQYRRLHASVVHRQESRAHWRPCDQHRRDHPLRGDRPVAPDTRPKGSSTAYAVIRPRDND